MKVLFSRLGNLTRKNAIRQGGIVLIDQGTLSLATFIAGVLVARSCTPQEYGLYILGWSVLLILQGFHKALVNVPLTVYIPRINAAERQTYQGSTLAHTLLIGLLLVLVLLALWTWNPFAGNAKTEGLNDLLPLLAITVIPFLLRDFMRNSMLAQLEVSASVVTSLVSTLLLVTIMAWLFAWNRLTLALSFYVYALTSALAAGYMLWTYRHRTRVHAANIRRDLAKNWGIGKWIVVNTFGFMAASQAYPWLLLYFRDAGDVAVFGVCLAVAGLLTPILRGATAYILPRMAHAYKDGNRAHLARMLRLSILLLAGPYGAWFLFGSLFGDELVTMFYSETYSGYGLLVILLLAKTFIESVSTPLTSALQALERTDIIAASLGAGAVVTLGVGSIMIVSMGVTGAGYAAVASSAVTTAWKWHGIRKILHTRGKTDG